MQKRFQVIDVRGYSYLTEVVEDFGGNVKEGDYVVDKHGCIESETDKFLVYAIRKVDIDNPCNLRGCHKILATDNPELDLPTFDELKNFLNDKRTDTKEIQKVV